jgi:hypothetical protein
MKGTRKAHANRELLQREACKPHYKPHTRPLGVSKGIKITPDRAPGTADSPRSPRLDASNQSQARILHFHDFILLAGRGEKFSLRLRHCKPPISRLLQK